MSELSFLTIAIGGWMRFSGQISIGKRNGALARKFFALRYSGSECSWFIRTGLAGNGLSGSGQVAFFGNH